MHQDNSSNVIRDAKIFETKETTVDLTELSSEIVAPNSDEIQSVISDTEKAPVVKSTSEKNADKASSNPSNKNNSSTTSPPYAREAIAYSGFVGKVDDIAFSFAKITKESAGHWNYVGSTTYKYIAVGATYANNLWYVSILVSETNVYG